ncbi:AAA family ATPase [Planococcus koreensis]|uniref:ATP-binding protein n=1 Tax=Planococcus koreensis TaxID=112331 RepID=UPI0039FCA6C3
MKIEKLVIYGFGKHQDREIILDPELSIIYGTNEAGKTTIQQFIIQTLFGYPSKNQNLRRYEPKNGGKYGGQLHIVDPDFGRVIIERVKGKSAGDVTLYFEDGSRGSETELKMILRDYDRASFESVFSFSIHELQGLENMNEEELSRTLLASGTTGMDAIARMESRLEKEMAVVFKKSGRNPEINLRVDELKSLDNDLKEYRRRIELYEPYVARVREIESRLDEMGDEEAELDGALKAAERWLQARPLLEKRQALEVEASTLPASAFPPDGRRRMDRLSDRLSEATAKIGSLEQQYNRMADQPETPKRIEELEGLLAKESGWHRLSSELSNKQQEIGKIADEQGRLLSLVGMDLEQALRADVSLNNEERLLFFVEQADQEEEEQRYHSRKVAEEKTKLEEASKELKFFLSGEPSEKERKEAEEWLAAAPKLAEAKAAGQLQGSSNPKNLMYILMGLGVLGFLIGIFQENYPLAVISILAAIAGAWMAFKGKKTETLPAEYQQVLAAYGGRETELNALIDKLAQYDRKLDSLLDNLEATKRQIATLAQAPQGQGAKEAYREFLQELGINPETGRKTVVELFGALREIQALQTASERLSRDIAKHTAEAEEWLAEASAACNRVLAQDGLYEAIRAEFSARKDHNASVAKSLAQKRELQAALAQAQSLALQIEQEQGALLQDAGALNLEQFYGLCDGWERLQEIGKQQAFLAAQLASLGDVGEMNGDSTADGGIESLEDKLGALKKERHALLAEKADKLQAAKTLLSDGEYEEKLQQFEEKKEELAELAMRWSIDKAITAAIRRTMDELKDKKLPAVIGAAQAYFSKLTGNAYSNLEMNPDGFFEAVREDGMRFHIAELSQATKEQAYISLRLSLAVSMRESHAFPVIMDDPFVHFDRRRLQHMINLITELQLNHQFIYFTCHETMKESWPKASIIDVADIGRSVHS